MGFLTVLGAIALVLIIGSLLLRVGFGFLGSLMGIATLIGLFVMVVGFIF